MSQLQEIAGLLARWFRFQPSEIDDLSVDELLDWAKTAGAQIDAAAEHTKR
ncbi:GpE family phage tail protein [Burkholderia cenocepacia]|nr:GpE family phage tail protein [Burkholderia cenocepacia]